MCICGSISIDWDETNYVICEFCLPTVALNFPNQKILTYLDFVIAKKHAFIRNILTMTDLNNQNLLNRTKDIIKHSEKCYKFSFGKFGNRIEDILDDCLAEFVKEMSIESFSDNYVCLLFNHGFSRKQI